MMDILIQESIDELKKLRKSVTEHTMSDIELYDELLEVIESHDRDAWCNTKAGPTCLVEIFHEICHFAPNKDKQLEHVERGRFIFIIDELLKNIKEGRSKDEGY